MRAALGGERKRQRAGGQAGLRRGSDGSVRTRGVVAGARATGKIGSTRERLRVTRASPRRDSSYALLEKDELEHLRELTTARQLVCAPRER